MSILSRVSGMGALARTPCGASRRRRAVSRQVRRGLVSYACWVVNWFGDVSWNWFGWAEKAEYVRELAGRGTRLEKKVLNRDSRPYWRKPDISAYQIEAGRRRSDPLGLFWAVLIVLNLTFLGNVEAQTLTNAWWTETGLHVDFDEEVDIDAFNGGSWISPELGDTWYLSEPGVSVFGSSFDLLLWSDDNQAVVPFPPPDDIYHFTINPPVGPTITFDSTWSGGVGGQVGNFQEPLPAEVPEGAAGSSILISLLALWRCRRGSYSVPLGFIGRSGSGSRCS